MGRGQSSSFHGTGGWVVDFKDSKLWGVTVAWHEEQLAMMTLLCVSLELSELSFFSVFSKRFSWELHSLTLCWKHLLLKVLFS